MHLLRRVLRALTASDSSSRKSAPVRLGLESLGERTMPAVTAALTAIPGTFGVQLVVQGDDQPNNITINQLGAAKYEVLSNGIAIVPKGAPGVTNFNAWTSSYLWNITVNGAGGNDTIRMFLNGSPAYTTLNGGNGDDGLTYSNTAAKSCTLVGGAGNDLLVGGGGRDFLFGDDPMYASTGSDVLIGGAGADELHGGSGEDLLIGGTAYGSLTPDAQLAALTNVRDQWATNVDYSTRVTLMSLPGLGFTGWSALPPWSVANDTDQDRMWGDGGRDWFFTDWNKDSICDSPTDVETKSVYWL